METEGPKLAALEALVDETFDAITEPLTPEAAQAVEVFTPPRSMETTVLRLTTQELAQIYGYRRLFETWFRRIGELLLERGIEGEELGEFYVANGRSFRHWTSEEEVVRKLSLMGATDEELFERKLKSPNKMMKVLREYGFRGKVLEQYIDLHIDRVPGKPTLVSRGDGRPALQDYTEGFDADV
jgi:hypothetical protein